MTTQAQTPMTLSEARIGLLFHEKRIAELQRALATSEAKLKEARELLKQSCDRFTHMAEYWNRNENDGAMSDALCNMIEEAEAGESAIDAFLRSET